MGKIFMLMTHISQCMFLHFMVHLLLLLPYVVREIFSQNFSVYLREYWETEMRLLTSRGHLHILMNLEIVQVLSDIDYSINRLRKFYSSDVGGALMMSFIQRLSPRNWTSVNSLQFRFTSDKFREVRDRRWHSDWLAGLRDSHFNFSSLQLTFIRFLLSAENASTRSRTHWL